MSLSDEQRERVRHDLLSILSYSCETQARNSPPTTEYITDRWMKPRLDALVDYVAEAEQRGADKVRERVEAVLHPEAGLGLAASGDGRRWFDEADIRDALKADS